MSLPSDPRAPQTVSRTSLGGSCALLENPEALPVGLACKNAEVEVSQRTVPESFLEPIKQAREYNRYRWGNVKSERIQAWAGSNETMPHCWDFCVTLEGHEPF